jgi:cardiolipin synthase
MSYLNQNIIDIFSIGYIITEWTIRIAMLIVVPLRRPPGAARGWLLVAFFIPVPALFIYLLIGRPTYPRWRRKRFEKARQMLAIATDEISHSQFCSRPMLPEIYAPAAKLVESLGQFPILGGNKIDLLADYDSMIDKLVTDISRANHHVHILTYIFADDRTGSKIIDALKKAAERGVDCRVLIDALGSRLWSRAIIDQLRSGGVCVVKALPVTFLRRRSARADLRNHRKIAIIDASIGYIGSQNIIDAEFSSGLFNRELVVQVAGPVVLEMQAVFAADWFLETGQVLDEAAFFRHQHGEGSTIAQLLPSGPDYPVAGAGRLVVALIHSARRRIVITTPYFIPNVALVQALETAVMRGVEVNLILSKASDSLLVGLAQRSYYEQMLRAGIAIYLYGDGLLHAKHVMIDELISVIGSTNIDIRSFQLNAEASLIIYDKKVAAMLDAEQDKNIAASDRLTGEGWEQRARPVKLLENMARLVSPLL